MTEAALIAVPASQLVLRSSHARDQLCVVLEGHYNMRRIVMPPGAYSLRAGIALQGSSTSVISYGF
jgi:hypothetical protein